MLSLRRANITRAVEMAAIVSTSAICSSSQPKTAIFFFFLFLFFFLEKKERERERIKGLATRIGKKKKVRNIQRTTTSRVLTISDLFNALVFSLFFFSLFCLLFLGALFIYFSPLSSSSCSSSSLHFFRSLDNNNSRIGHYSTDSGLVDRAGQWWTRSAS